MDAIKINKLKLFKNIKLLDNLHLKLKQNKNKLNNFKLNKNYQFLGLDFYKTQNYIVHLII